MRTIQFGLATSIAILSLAGLGTGCASPDSADANDVEEGTTASTESAIVSGTYTATGSMAAPRFYHTASRLADGRVLAAGGQEQHVIAGGFIRASILASAELYNSASGTWTTTGSMTMPREAATQTTLADGRVLVAGGFNGVAGGEQKSMEIYTPATGKWAAGAKMAKARMYNLAVRLANGRVLVAGGGNTAVTGDLAPTGEVYNPTTNTWVATGAIPVASSLAAEGVLLADGRVMTALGTSGGYTGFAGGGPAIYNPTTNAWTRLPAPPLDLGDNPHLALLASGHVLFTGGIYSWDYAAQNYVEVNAVEEIDPATGAWTVLSSVNFSFGEVEDLTALPDGRVLASGWDYYHNTTVDKVYAPATGVWSTVAGVDRNAPTITTLANGTLLFAGGYLNGSQSNTTASTKIFNP